MKRTWMRKTTISLVAILAAGQVWAGSYTQFTVEGNGRIDAGIVLGTAGLTQGKAVNDSELNDAVQRLFASGLFSDVQVDVSGNRAVISVVENATISGVYFEGNDKIKDEQLAAVVKLTKREGLDQAKIDEDIQSIKRAYASKSRYTVGVEAQAISNNNGTYKLVYVIDEGTVSEIKRITFSGNSQVSDWKLRRVVSSTEAGLFSGLFSRDNFATEKLDSDKQTILDYYLENGYYDVQIKAAQADYDAGGNFYISYSISEGPKYRIGKVTFSNNVAGIDMNSFAAVQKLRKGRIFKASEVKKAVEAIEVEAERRGLPFLRAEPVITTNDAAGILDINFALNASERVYVERIDIHGNDQTVDRVIRRKFKTTEGDPLNARKISTARQEIEKLGFFSEVKVEAREGSTANQKIIDVEVAEDKTGQLSFGGSYSTGESWSLGANFQERNFLGRGQYLALNVDYGAQKQTGRFSFAEPSLFDRDLLGGFDIYYSQSTSSASGFSSTDVGFEPRLSIPTSDDSRLSLGYFLKRNELNGFSTTTSPLITADEGSKITSGVTATWNIDKTNNSRNPTKGWILRLGGKYAGLGGDANWLQTGAKGKVYFAPWRNDIIFSAEAEGGAIKPIGDDSIRVNERYFLGGSSGLKGFSSGGVGPRDSAGDINSALGGKNYVAARASVTFPVGLPEELGISGGAFWELGSVWGLDNVVGGASGTVNDEMSWRGSRGLSLLWNLGGQTLSFNWSDSYMKEDQDKLEPFSVSFASKF